MHRWIRQAEAWFRAMTLGAPSPRSFALATAGLGAAALRHQAVAPALSGGLFEQRLAEAMTRGYVAAYRWLGDGERAREALQEAATRALGARHRYDRARPFYPWFYKILRNHCFDVLRRGGRETLREGDSNIFDQPEAAVRRPSAESALIENERQRGVLAAITELPPELREVIELRHFQDLSYAEIAATLECPQGTVMSRLYRARKALRSRLSSGPEPTLKARRER